MIRTVIAALMLALAPGLALAQNPGHPSYPDITISGSKITGVGTGAGTVAAGNDNRIVGATQNAAAAITGGTINGAVIGGSSPAPITGTTITGDRLVGPLSGNAATATALATARTFSLSGDAACSFVFDGTANAGCALALAPTGVSAGTYGSATTVPAVTVDAKGRVTGVSAAAIVFPVTSVVGRTGAVSLGVADVTGAAPLADPTFTGTATAPAVALTGSGSTGAIPNMTVPLSGRSVAPTLATALGMTAQVEFFRLPADGADWGPGIQRAQQFLAATGGMIRISTPGALAIATQVSIPKGNPYLKLSCDSQATVLTNAASLTSAMFSAGGSTASGGLNFDADGCAFAGANTSASNAFVLNNANGMTVKNASFTNMATAFNANASYAVSLENVVFNGVTSPFYSTTSAHNFVARRVKAYGGGTVFRFDGATDNASIVEGDFEGTGSVVKIAGGTALRYIGNYTEYFTADPIEATAPLYGADISNNWIALGSGGLATWSLKNFVGGQLKGNAVHNQAITFGAGTTDIEVGDNRIVDTGSVQPTPYQAPTLGNSWTQQANYSLVGFRKGRDGKVYLRGNLLNSTAALGTAAFTLPAGYQPGTIRTFSTSNSANGLTAVQIGADGTVKIMQTSGAGASGNPYQASLDGVSFEPGT